MPSILDGRLVLVLHSRNGPTAEAATGGDDGQQQEGEMHADRQQAAWEGELQEQHGRYFDSHYGNVYAGGW